MKELEKQINEKIMKERNTILENGDKIKGKQSKIINRVLSEYDLSEYEVMNIIPFHISLKVKGTHKMMRQKAKEQQEKAVKIEKFKKQVMDGHIKESISDWIESHHPEYEVRHSRSIVYSESFYIYEKGSCIALVKLSLHNTIAQEDEYKTPFLNLSNYINILDLKRDIEKKLGG